MADVETRLVSVPESSKPIRADPQPTADAAPVVPVVDRIRYRRGRMARHRTEHLSHRRRGRQKHQTSRTAFADGFEFTGACPLSVASKAEYNVAANSPKCGIRMHQA